MSKTLGVHDRRPRNEIDRDIAQAAIRGDNPIMVPTATLMCALNAEYVYPQEYRKIEAKLGEEIDQIKQLCVFALTPMGLDSKSCEIHGKCPFTGVEPLPIEDTELKHVVKQHFKKRYKV
ncbi:hypothetical protein KJ632_00310 [Patescibacteria group bacterium]|nr:hypothetical protein [Patescibacteria group bacterium]